MHRINYSLHFLSSIENPHRSTCIHPLASRLGSRSDPFAHARTRSRSPARLDGSEEGSPPPRSRTPSQAPPTWPPPLVRNTGIQHPLRPRASINSIDWAGPCDVIPRTETHTSTSSSSDRTSTTPHTTPQAKGAMSAEAEETRPPSTEVGLALLTRMLYVVCCGGWMCAVVASILVGFG